MRTAAAASLLVGLSLLSSSRLLATCPRTGGEKARRIGAAIMAFPYTHLVLRHNQSQVPLPVAGVRVRVSEQVEGKVKFTEGRFVSASDSVLRLVNANGDTLAFPRADARCLQTQRKSREIGAGPGLVAGGAVGSLTGMVVGSNATSGPVETFVNGLVGGAIGGFADTLVGVVRGANVWDVAWERAK